LYGDNNRIKISNDYTISLTNNNIHAAIICTPINTHINIATNFLFAGKHVLIQKPAAVSEKEAVLLISAASSKNLKLMASHTFLFHPAVQYLKEYIKIIGKILHIKSSRINLGLFSRSNSVIDDLLPHDYSILSYLVNEELKFISATGTDSFNTNFVDTVNSSLQYDGFNANIDVSWISAVKVRKLMIIGSEKTVVFDDCSDLKVVYYDSGVVFDDVDSIFSYRKGNVYAPKLSETEAILGEVNHFAECVIKDKRPISGPDQILQVAKMLDMTKISVKYKGMPCQLIA
jgi:predicted dehydrogenase